MDGQQEASPFVQNADDGLLMRPSGEWAKDKLDILAHYITTSTIAMQKKPWRRRFYIDLQAGPGKNCVRAKGKDECPDVDRNVFLGSPLLALTKGAGYTDYRFVEQDEEAAAALRRRCEAMSGNFSLRIDVADCNAVVDDIVQEIRNIDAPYIEGVWPTLALAFLDPEGLELHWKTVLKLASNRTDILINFSIQGLRRAAKGALDLQPGEARTDRFFGTTAWRDIPFNPDGSTPAHQWMELYQERLIEQGYRCGTPQSVKNSKNAELYRLLFASKHELGIKLWEEARKNAPTQLSLL